MDGTNAILKSTLYKWRSHPEGWHSFIKQNKRDKYFLIDSIKYYDTKINTG